MTCDIPVIVNCAKSRLLCAQAQTKHVFHSFTSTSRHKRGCDGLRCSVVLSVEIKLLALNDATTKNVKTCGEFSKKGDQDGSVMGLLWGEAGANLCLGVAWQVPICVFY